MPIIEKETISEKEEPTIVEKVEQAEQTLKQFECPPGYLEIRLSSKGKYGAPPVFHCRNFSTEDLVHLAVSDDSEIAQRTVEFLNGIIYEDIDVSNFHEKEVIETLFIIYRTFYGHILNDLPWQLDESDKEWLAAQYPDGVYDAKYKNQIEAYENGEWKPTFFLDLNNISFYDIDPDTVKTQAVIKNSITGFSCIYSWPRYGDVLKVKEYTDIIFKERDKQFASIQEVVRFRNQAEQKALSGGRVDLTHIPNIPKAEREKLRLYEEEKLNFMTTCLRAIQLKEIRGVDISNMTLDQRIKYAQDPELDFATFKAIQSKFSDELKIGVNDNLTLLNPVTEEMCTRRVSFRIDAIISAFRDAKPAGVTISLE